MAGEEQNVSVTLGSKADTSGFQKFEDASRSLTAQKREHSRANDVLVDSERRVRSNLDATISGLANAKDGTEAMSVAVGHLSEVFKLGFAGVVIGGIAATIIEGFSKARQEIEKTGEDIKKLSDDSEATLEKLKGFEPTAKQTAERDLARREKDLRDLEERQRSAGGDVFHTMAIGAGALGFGSADIRDQQNQAELVRVRAQLAEERRLIEQPGRFADKRADAEAQGQYETQKRQETERDKLQEQAAASTERLLESKMTPEERLAEMKQRMDFLNSAIKQNSQFTGPEAQAGTARLTIQKNEIEMEYNRLLAEENKLKSEISRKDESAKEQAERRLEAERRNQEAQAAREAGLEMKGEAGRKVENYVVAGSEHALGGGGRAYGGVNVRDPAVEEARKHTELLQRIASLLSPGAAAPNMQPQAVLS